MKKLLSVLLALMVVSTLSFGQSKFGIKAGLNFNTLEDVTESGSVNQAWKNQTGYHFGIAWQFKIPIIGIGVQPELLYSKVRTSFAEAYTGIQPQNGMIASNSIVYPTLSEIEMDYLTLPINIQLGLDLLILRPFIVVSPYISYALQKGGDLTNQDWDDINRFNYGVGAGVGLDIWKLQIMGKYNWGLGKLESATNTTWEEKYENAKIQGFQLSVAFLF